MIPTSTIRAVADTLETTGHALRLRLRQIIETLPDHKPATIRRAVDHLADERNIVIIPPGPARHPRQILVTEAISQLIADGYVAERTIAALELVHPYPAPHAE